MRNAFLTRHAGPALCAALSLPGLPAAQAAEWAFPDAAIRAEVEVAAPPSVPDAGVLAILPDGGILPRPGGGLAVTDAGGKELAAVCVWHNPAEGMGVVFDPPADGRRAVLYLFDRPRPGAPGPGAGRLKPSLFLYTACPGTASLDGAQKPSSDAPPGRRAMMGTVPRIGQRQNPFGPDDHYVSWYTGWLRITQAGAYRICTISDEGSLVKVDGKVVASWPGLHGRDGGRKGEFGGNVELSAGDHPIEYFHFEQTGDQEADACWKPPGGKGDALPVTIPDGAYLHSGGARLVSAETRGGGTPAAFAFSAVSYLWFGERPVNLFRLVAGPLPSAFDTNRLEWTLGEGLALRQTELPWLVGGDGLHPVSLSVKNGREVSRATRSLSFGATPAAASVENAGHRTEYRKALLARCEAVASSRRPCEGWSPDLWAVLLQVMELYKGDALLRQVFERSRKDVLALAPADRHFLEDLYFEVLRYTDKEGAAKWLDRFETEERDFPRKGYWRIARVDFRLYDLEDLDGARRLADGIRASADPETTVRAAIRQGDVERFRGKYDEAAKLYAQAQDMPRAAPRQATAPTARPREEAAKPKGPAEKPKAGADGPSRERPAVTGAISLPATREPWKAEAVRESSYYRTAHDLIGKGCLYEARDVLRRWELELPLSKISGDYSLAEAEYFRTIRDFRRALKILRAYREGTEMSAFLADAMEMEIQCLVQLGRDKEIVELAKEFERRFPGHPAAERARSLSGIVKGQASTETPGPAIVEKP